MKKQHRKGKNMLKNSILVFATLVLTVGCVKDRPKVDAQGSNLDNLIKVSDVRSWDHQVETSDTTTLGETTNSRKLEVDSELVNIKFPNVVNLSTEAPLLKGSIEKVDYFGKAKSTYNVKYELTPNLLKIYKVIPDSDLSHYEMPYAKKSGSNWLIPIGGYGVTYYSVELIKNSDEENSNRRAKYFVPPEEFGRASHIQINRKKFIPFSRVAKKDVLPSDYFTSSEWYYSAAIISTKPEEQSGVGYVDGTADASLKKRATLVRFSKTEEQLRATNVVRDARIDISEDQADIVFNIPVKWFDSRIKPDGSEESLSEELIPNLRYSSQPWGEFDFRNIVAIKSGGNSRVQKFFNGIVLDSLIIKKDSFSFTLLYLGSGKKEKFSFLKAKARDYQPKIYFKEDRKLFGAFEVEKYRLANLDEHREEDAEKNVLVQRFNPKKDITFRFSTMTPKLDKIKASYSDTEFTMDYRELGRNCTKYWNRAFELAGTNVKVKLDESRDAELGDFDSNILNIIPILSNGGGGGVGPSVADPITGETISATTNVFVTNGMIKGRADKVRDFIRVSSGRVPDPYLLDPEKKRIPILNQISKDVRQFCPEVIQFAAELKEKGAKHRVSTVEENRVVIPCVERIMKPRLQGILCHEMGHNLGLRHNFYCSADPKNMAMSYKSLETMYPKADFPEIYRDFYPKEELLPPMTCVMDYADFDEFNMPAMPMSYDVAALAFIYSDKLVSNLDLEKGKIELKGYDPTQQLITQNVYGASHKFKYCTDEQSVERGRELSVDPMCALWDNGVTPKEKLDHLFRSLRETVILESMKFDRNLSYRDGGLDKFYIGTMKKMSGIYGSWRAHLTGKVGDDNKYLDKMSPERYSSLLKTLASDDTFKGKEYLGVADIMYGIFSEIFNMPDYYCVSTDERGDVKLFDFESLQKEVVANSADYNVEGCRDPKVSDYLAKAYGYKYIDEIGSPMNSIKFSLDPYDARETKDLLGTNSLRMAASGYMLGRHAKITYPMIVADIQPALIDEPHLYKKFISDFKSRVLNGFKPGISFREKLNTHSVKISGDTRIAKFGNAWPIIDNALKFLLVGGQKNIAGIVIPSKRGSTKSEKINDFIVKAFRSKTDLDESRAFYFFRPQALYIQPEADAQFAISLMEKVIELEKEKESLRTNSDVKTFMSNEEISMKISEIDDHYQGALKLFLTLVNATK